MKQRQVRVLDARLVLETGKAVLTPTGIAIDLANPGLAPEDSCGADIIVRSRW